MSNLGGDSPEHRMGKETVSGGVGRGVGWTIGIAGLVGRWVEVHVPAVRSIHRIRSEERFAAAANEVLKTNRFST